MNIAMKKLATYLLVMAGVYGWLSTASAQVSVEYGSKHSVAIDYAETDTSVTFFIENKNPFPVTVEINVSSKNLDTSSGLPYRRQIAPKTRLQAFTMTQAIARRGWSFRTSSQWYIGVLNAEHDEEVTYALPFESGTSHIVGQGYFGRYSHKGSSAYSVDFNMPIGTPVHAARSGVVVRIKEDSNIGGKSPGYNKHSNYISIMHSDGTFGKYGHLRQYGVEVEIGDTVKKHQMIGYSGDTGYSTGPHLHFEVYKRISAYEQQSIPVEFETKEGLLEELKRGETYTAK